MGQNICLVPFNTLIFAWTGRSMKNFSGEKKSFFFTRPTCSLGEIAPQALWRSRGAPKTSNQLLWVYYTVIRLIGPSWGHLGAHRGPKVPIAHWEANFRLTGRNCPTSPVALWRGPKDLKPVTVGILHGYMSYWPFMGPFRGTPESQRANFRPQMRLIFAPPKYRHVGCPDRRNENPCSYNKVSDHIGQPSQKKTIEK